MDTNIYFSVYNLKKAVKKQTLGYDKKIILQFGWETFTLSAVAYITVDFKKWVSDLCHTGFALVESQCINKKMRLSE